MPKSLGNPGCRSQLELCCAGVTLNAELHESYSTPECPTHLQLRGAEEPETPGCRIHPDLRDARYTRNPVGSVHPKLRGA